MLDISVRINDLFMFVNGLAGNGVSPLSRFVMNLLYLLRLFIIYIASI